MAATAKRNGRAQQPALSAESSKLLDQILANTDHRQQTAAKLLDEIVNRQQSGRARGMSEMLNGAIEKLRSMLSPNLKPHAERFVNVASFYFATKQGMEGCPASQFVRCVFESARVGLAIDGQLCHVVRYNKIWQCQPDYKGLIEVARASGRIEDIEAKEICENDHFVLKQIDGGVRFEFDEADFFSERGEIIGVWCRVWLPNSRVTHKVSAMRLSDLEKIRSRSPMAGKNYGPWVTDFAEMCKKTIIRRELKPYVGDPMVAAVVAMSDAADGFNELDTAPADPPPLPRGRTSLRGKSPIPAPDPETQPEPEPSLEPDEQAQPEAPDDDLTDSDQQRMDSVDMFSERIREADAPEKLTAPEREFEACREWLGRECAGQVDLQPGKVRVGIEAPREVPIFRKELADNERKRLRPDAENEGDTNVNGA